MALETERRTPEDAASPGGSDGSAPEERRPSAFHRIELLCDPGDKFPLHLPVGALPRAALQGAFRPSKEATAPQPPPTAPSSLPFSVDNILRPEFGRTAPRRPGALQEQPRRRPPDDEYPDPAKIDPPIPEDPASQIWPAWVYCTRYSDRPSSGPRYRRKAAHSQTGSPEGPRSRRIKRKDKNKEDKRPRTAFSGEQLARLKSEFSINRYLTERRRQALASELGLNEAQIKIWFQNKRAKIKKASGARNPLALQLMAQGLYNHSTVPMSDDESEESVNSAKH